MATILPFVVRPRTPSTRRPADSVAAIVIFPGVRYEARRDDHQAGGSEGRPGDTPRRKRKGKTA
jgi:hypothetical protein